MKIQPDPRTPRPRFQTAYTLLLICLLSTLPPGLARAQVSETSGEPSNVFVEEVSVRVINVDVTVTDRSGEPVAGLGRADFEIRLDGQPIPISNFYAETRERVGQRSSFDTPTERDPSFRSLEEIREGATRRSHVILLVDHTRLRAINRKRAFAAMKKAVSSLGRNDLVSVIGIEGGLVFYSDFLFDRQAINRILDDVTRVAAKTDVNEIERRRIFGELQRGISGGIQARASLADESQLGARIQAYAANEYNRGLTTLRQIETVVSTLSGVPGRKTLLYLGEGVPTRPGEGLYIEFRNRFSGPERGLPQQNLNTNYRREVGEYDLTQPMRQLASAANSAGVTIFAIDAESSHGGELRSALTEQGATSEAVSAVEENFRAPLEYASKATGGRLLRSSGKLTDQLLNLVSGLQTFYSLGFTPPPGWQPGSEKKLKVDVKTKGLRVNHREDIRLPKADEREAGATVAALMYQTVDNPLEIVAKPGFEAPRDDGTAVLPITLEIPIARIEFLPQDDMQAASLTIYVSSKDREGNPGRVQKIPFHLPIPADKIEEARGESAHYPLPLVVRSGDRQVAIGIRDNTSGAFSAVRLDIAQYSQF